MTWFHLQRTEIPLSCRNWQLPDLIRERGLTCRYSRDVITVVRSASFTRARGPSRSIAPTTVMRQVESFVEQGFAEIVICGIDLGSYGDDLENDGNFDMNLAVLTSELAERHPDTRFRLSSIDPAHITSRLVSVIERYDNVCPHIHLSLQSASPIILKRMKRRYQPDDVYSAVAALRNVRSDLVLSADIMAGFPTETESDFEMTKSAIFDLEIAYPHVFAYSERDGTPAARIPKQVPPEVRKTRARVLRHAGDTVRQKVLSGYVGKSAEVLTECRVSHTKSNDVPCPFIQLPAGLL